MDRKKTMAIVLVSMATIIAVTIPAIAQEKNAQHTMNIQGCEAMMNSNFTGHGMMNSNFTGHSNVMGYGMEENGYTDQKWSDLLNSF